MIETLSQFGVAGISLGIITLVVKYFIKAIETKDSNIQNLIADNNKRNDEKDKVNLARYDAITAEYQKLTNEYITEGVISRNKHIEVLQELTNCVKGCPKRS